MIIMLAIVIASCTFGLNQIIVLSDDIKFIKAMVKDHLVPPSPTEQVKELITEEEQQA